MHASPVPFRMSSMLDFACLGGPPKPGNLSGTVTDSDARSRPASSAILRKGGTWLSADRMSRYGHQRLTVLIVRAKFRIVVSLPMASIIGRIAPKCAMQRRRVRIERTRTISDH